MCSSSVSVCAAAAAFVLCGQFAFSDKYRFFFFFFFFFFGFTVTICHVCWLVDECLARRSPTLATLSSAVLVVPSFHRQKDTDRELKMATLISKHSVHSFSLSLPLFLFIHICIYWRQRQQNYLLLNSLLKGQKTIRFSVVGWCADRGGTLVKALPSNHLQPSDIKKVVHSLGAL